MGGEKRGRKKKNLYESVLIPPFLEADIFEKKMGSKRVELNKKVLTAEEKIIEVLFVSMRALTPYQIQKRTGVSHSTLHYKLKVFEKSGFLRVAKKEKYRTGLSSAKYELTPKALNFLFGRFWSAFSFKNLCFHPQLSEDPDLLRLYTTQLADEVTKYLDYWADKFKNEVEPFRWWSIFKKTHLLKRLFFSIFTIWDNFPGVLLGFFSKVLERSDTLLERRYIKDALVSASLEEKVLLEYYPDHLGLKEDYRDIRLLFSSKEKEKIREELKKLMVESEPLRELVRFHLQYFKTYYTLMLSDISYIANELQLDLNKNT